MWKQSFTLQLFGVGLINNDGSIKYRNYLHTSTISTTLIIRVENQDFLVTGSYDKFIKIWKLSEEGMETNPFGQYQLAKKVKHLLKTDNSLIVSDKHGDIYSITDNEILKGSTDIVKKLIPIQANLAIPKLFKQLKIDDKDILILADDYSKIKIFNLTNLDEILNVLIPFEAFLKQIIEVDEQLICLFKIKDEENDNTHYSIRTIVKKELISENYEFKEIFPLNELEKSISRAEKMRLIYQSNQLFLVNQNQGDIKIFKNQDFEKPYVQIPNETIWQVIVISQDYTLLNTQKQKDTPPNEQNNLKIPENQQIQVYTNVLHHIM